MRLNVLRVLIFSAILGVATPRAGEDGLAFEPVKGDANGTQAALARREAEIREKTGKPEGESLGHNWWLWGLANIDYDNDGDQDLIVGVHGPRHGIILKNQFRETGKVAFTDVTKELGADGLVPSADWNAFVWDFDGDGFLDIAGMFNDAPTTALLNEGGKRFVKAPFHFHPVNKAPLITDLNGDGHPDVYFAYKTEVTFTYDPSGKNYKKVSQPHAPPARLDPAVLKDMEELKSVKNGRFLAYLYESLDLDGDGLKDLAMGAFGSYGGPRRGWYLKGGQDGALTLAGKDLGLPPEGTPFFCHDLNGDGAVDILIASSPSGGLYLNDGKGHFALKPGPVTDFVKEKANYLQRAFAVDFDNDGDLDLVVSNRRGGAVRVFENQGGGIFTDALGARGWDADPVVIGDLNEDGKIDLAVGGPKYNEVTLYLNQTARTGAWCKIVPRMPSPNPFAVDARVEIFKAGDLGKEGAKPVHTENAHPDGTPVHAGLGSSEAFDVRVTFPGAEKKVVEGKGLAANGAWKITLDGKVEPAK
ncbi:MAG: VCBS repeat-containing protein [Planctomycetota bacterium]|nr:VCBS repeat-containing protein [Planctomycetota bacterium]